MPLFVLVADCEPHTNWNRNYLIDYLRSSGSWQSVWPRHYFLLFAALGMYSYAGSPVHAQAEDIVPYNQEDSEGRASLQVAEMSFADVFLLLVLHPGPGILLVNANGTNLSRDPSRY